MNSYRTIAAFFKVTKKIRKKLKKGIDLKLTPRSIVSDIEPKVIRNPIAKNGGTAVFGTFAPFFQRTYDQLSHDVALNNSPSTMLVLQPGVFGMNSNTHIAICDIQMFAHISNFVYFAPTTREEFDQMFKYATSQKYHPTGIRTENL